MLFYGAYRVEPEPGAAFAVLRYLLHRSDRRSLMAEIGGVYEILRLLTPPIGVEVRRGTGEHGFEIFARGRWHAAVEYFPVAFDDRRNVERGLHAPLYLQRGDARVAKRVDAVVQAQVLHRERKRTGAERVRIRQPTAVGAPAAVSAPAPLHRREEAESRNGIAQRSVHEHFDLAAAALDDGADILDRQFAGEHHAREAKFLERENTFEIVRDKLRRGVYGQ